MRWESAGEGEYTVELSQAKVVREGEVRIVGPEEVVVGDLLEVDAGDHIIVDGELTEGRMEVDESQLTGESVEEMTCQPVHDRGGQHHREHLSHPGVLAQVFR